jgi:hypothetical protein
MTEFAAGNTGTKAVVAYADRLVLESVGEIVFALRHGADKDTNALIGVKRIDIISHSNDIGVETQSDLATFGREMISDWIFDDFEQFLLGIDRPNRQLVQQLNHQSSKSFECAWDADCRTDFDENTFGRMNIDLQSSSFVDGRIEKSEKALVVCEYDMDGASSGPYLMCDIWSSLTDVSAHFTHDANVLVAVQERILLFLGAFAAGVGCSVCFETGVGQHHNQSLGALVS